MAWKNKEAEVAYKHAWYMANRARLGKADRVQRTPAEIVQYKSDWYIKNKVRLREEQRIRYATDPVYAASIKTAAGKRYIENRDEIKVQVAAYAKANPERTRTWHREWKARNRNAVLARSRIYANEWRRKNPERAKAAILSWCMKNQEKINAYGAAYRARKMKAMPTWADNDLIESFYRQARGLTYRTGVRHSVDHIYPLKHDRLCGLHVPWNLQILTFSENSKKKNNISQFAGAV